MKGKNKKKTPKKQKRKRRANLRLFPIQRSVWSSFVPEDHVAKG